MGTVYLAEQITMHRLVAVKVVRRIVKSKSDTIARFTREAHAVASLRHTNIVQAFDFDHADGVPYIVMEHIEGLSANQLVEKVGPIPYTQPADFVMQAAAGLEHAHQNNMVHRDVKPGNVMINTGGVVKLLDLGLCTMCEKNNDSLTTDDDQLGTVDYIAPEQAMDSHNADIRADIYSLGAVSYYLLSGQILFPDASTAQKLIYCQSAQPTPLEQLVPDVPPELIKIINKMLSKNPDDRYRTPAEVIRAVEEFAVRRVSPFEMVHIENGRDEFGRYLRRSPALSTIRATSSLPMDAPPTEMPSGSTTASLIAAKTLKTTDPNFGEAPTETVKRSEVEATPVEQTDEPSKITGGLSEVIKSAPDSSTSSSPVEQLSKVAQKIPEPIRKSKLVQAMLVSSLLALGYFGGNMFLNTPDASASPITTNNVVPTENLPKPDVEAAVAVAVVTESADVNVESVAEKTESTEPAEIPVVSNGPQSALDELNRSDIPPYELGVAKNAASNHSGVELVSIMGDSRFKHWHEAIAACATPDGKELITAGLDYHVRIWDIDTGFERRSIQSPTGNFSTLALSPNGSQFATADNQGFVRLYDRSSGREVWNSEFESRIHKVLFNRRGDEIFMCLGWKQVIVLDSNSGEKIDEIANDFGVSRTCINANGTVLAVAGWDSNDVVIWDPRTRDYKTTLVGHEKVVKELAFNDKGTLLATVSSDDLTMKVWDVEQGTQKASTNFKHWSAAVSFLPNSDTVLLNSGSASELFNVEEASFEEKTLFWAGRQIIDYDFIDEHRFVYACRDCSIGIFELTTRKSVYSYTADTGRATAIRLFELSKDGNTCLTSDRREIKRWDLTKGEIVSRNDSFWGVSNSIDLSIDKTKVISTDWSGKKMRVFESDQAEHFYEEELVDKLASCEFSTDPRIFAAAVQHESVSLRDSSTGEVITELEYSAEDTPHNCLAFSKNGELLAGGGFACIAIWNTTTGKLVTTLRPENKEIVPDFHAVSFLGGDKLVAADSDGAVSLWDVKSGKME